MCIRQWMRSFRTVIISTLAVAALASSSVADAVDTAENVVATEAEASFINEVIAVLNSAVPAPEGWNAETSFRVSGNTIKEGRPIMIYEPARDSPLLMKFSFNFRQPTETQQITASAQKSGQQLQQELMAAYQRGDHQKAQQIQQELMALSTAGLAQMNKQIHSPGNSPKKKQPRIQVQVNFHGDGEVSSKALDIETPPGVVYAKSIMSGTKGDTPFYTYYVGRWEVTSFDKKNWSIKFPKSLQTSENHLKAMVATVTVSGSAGAVEDYIKTSLNLRKIASIIE